MSTNWKDIGKNSGNMQHNRNVKFNKLDYEKGKWDSVYDISGNKKKGYTFDICGENIVVGIGTSKPFSRLSLGTSTTSGEFNSKDTGQLAAIAVNETSIGGNFKGIMYDTKLADWENSALTHTGLRILSSDKDSFDMTDVSSGKIIIGTDNVVTIGGEPSQGNKDDGSNITGKKVVENASLGGNSQIVLDVKGSIKTNGYINFYNYNGGDEIPNGVFWNENNAPTFANIPRGSLWISPGGGNNGQDGLYFKDTTGSIVYVDPTGSGGSASTAGAFDASFSSVPPFIIQKAPDTAASTKSGGVNMKLDGLSTTDTPTNGADFNNLLTLTRGNLAICGVSGELKAWPTTGSPLLANDFIGNANAGIPLATDISGGLVWIQRQLAIGPNKYDKNWSVIDMQTVPNAAALMSYNQKDTNLVTWSQFKPIKATNALILLNKLETDDGTSGGAIIGNKHDCSNSIIIGNSFAEINTPNSLISNHYGDLNGQTINDNNGHNIIFGENRLEYSPYTIMFGQNNSIDNSNNDTANDLTNGGGTLIMGKDNVIDNSGETMNNVNVIIGMTNKFGYGEQNLIVGEENEGYGSNNILFGEENINGIDLPGGFKMINGKNYSGNFSFMQGLKNKVLVPYGKTTEGVFIAGNHNTLDVSGSSYVSNKGYVLLGSYVGISGENPHSPRTDAAGKIIEDLSSIKFAFGTDEMYNLRNQTDKDIYGGNVFTIDSSGNTRIFGNLIVDGSNVVLRTEYVDVSDNNLALNYPGTGPQEGGGITIMNSTPALNKVFSWTANGPSNDCWNTNNSDISTNDIYAIDISCQDISCVDLSAQHVFFTGNMNVIDISAVDISANGYFYGNTFTTTGHSQFNDISCADLSCVDLSCVDISGRHAFFTGDLSCNGKLTVGGVIDPIGMIFTTDDGTSLGIMTNNEGGIYTDGNDLFFIPKNKSSTSNSGNDVKKFALVAPGSSGSGMTKWVISNGTDTSDVTEGLTVKIIGGSGITSTQSTRDITLALTNDSVTIGTTAIALGNSSTTLAGLTSVTSTSFTGNLTGDVTGNADSATSASSADSATTAGSADSATTAATADDIAGGIIGQILYQDAADSTAKLTANLTTTKQFLTGTGTGTAGQAPVWGTIADGDLPNSININPNSTSGGALTITNTPATQTSGNLVSITGDTGEIALNIVTGDLKVESGEVMTTKISYTDGDDAITIADGGGCTFAQNVAMGANSITGLAAPSSDNDAATKKYVDDLNSGGSGSSANAEQSKRVRIGKDDGSTERHILFSISPSASPAYQDISGSANLKCTPSTGTFTATTFSGALSGNITSDTTSLGGDATFSFTRPDQTQTDTIGSNTSIKGQKGDGTGDGGNLILAGGDKGSGGTNDGSVVINSNWTATGKTCADLGTVTTVTIETGDVTVGTGKTLNVSAGTLTTSAAQNKAIVEGAGADVDIGAYKLTAKTLVSDVATGTAPLTVTSTTVVPNLHASEVTGDVTVGSGKTLTVSAGTLTTSAAQKNTIVSGGVQNDAAAAATKTPNFIGQIYVDTTGSSEKAYIAYGTGTGEWIEVGSA